MISDVLSFREKQSNYANQWNLKINIVKRESIQVLRVLGNCNGLKKCGGISLTESFNNAINLELKKSLNLMKLARKC